MELRDALRAVFGRLRKREVTGWREIGGYAPVFTPYSGQMYLNDTCRACVRTLAEHTSKANATTRGDKKLETLLNVRPNMYMSGKDFLYKMRTLYEVNNTAFAYINRDDAGEVLSVYPVPQCPSEAVDSGGELYIRFWLPNGTQLIAAWADLIVLRKDYNGSDIWGDPNTAIGAPLELLHTTMQGMGNAIKATANLRGILKSTKAMIAPDDAKRLKDEFVNDYVNISNKSGVALLDATQEFIPVNMRPQVADHAYVKELRENIFRYFGVNEAAIKNELVGDAADSFYEGAIEPFLLALSLEATYKIYTPRERGHGNEVAYEANRMQFMTIASKLALVQMVDRAALTANEWRAVMNMPPVEGGDELQKWQAPQGTRKGVDADAGKDGSGVSGDEPTAADGK